jgi:diguanylate cyclase (GGDEF)-like protein
MDHAPGKDRRSAADDFKPVNDRHGHAAGDAVLQAVALRLRACMRDSDTVARLGGDEFAVVLDNPAPDSLDRLAQQIVAAIAEPCWHAGEPLTVGVSVGLAINAGGKTDGDQLVSRLELAWVADVLAQDLIAEFVDSPSGSDYEPAADPTWWNRYPGW